MRYVRMFLPLSLLLAASLACALPGGLSDGALFKDDFSRPTSGWGANDDTEGESDYENGEYVFRIHTGDWFFWANPEEQFSNIHLEVTARNMGEAEDPGFGLLCNYQDSENFYFFGIGVDGFYAIGMLEQDDFTILSGGGEWAESSELAINAEQYRIGADCGHGELTLYVDGKAIETVSHTTFTEGDIGLYTESVEQDNVEVHFDDFIVTTLAKP